MTCDEKTQRIDAICHSATVIPVLTFDNLDTVIPISRALVAGGLKVLEVTLRTPVALAAINKIRTELPEACVGAGTILTPKQYDEACAAGSEFIVTPGLTATLLEKGLTSNIPLLPGIQTFSEILLGVEMGYERFKFFPAASSGGLATLRSFGGPLQGIKFCPTGGISLQTAKDYLALDNVMCVGGSWLTPKEAIAAQDWTEIERLASQTLITLKS